MFAQEFLLLNSPRTHIVFKDYRGRHLIDQSLVLLACLFPHASVKDGLMGNNRRKTLVKEGDGHVRNGLSPPSDKFFHAAQVLAWLSVGLCRMPYHQLIDLLLPHIMLEKVEEFMGGYRCQTIGNDAQRVGHRQPRALASIVDGQDSPHLTRLLSEQPSVWILRAQLVTALYCRCLIAERRGHYTIHIARRVVS